MENQINVSRKGGLLSWFLFFITYTFGYLGFLAYTETQKGIAFKLSDFFVYFLTSGLLFYTAIIVVAALISSQALYRTYSKIFLFVIIGTIIITIYRSFSYFMFFLKFDQILIIFFILFIAAIIGFVFRKVLERSYTVTKVVTSSVMILVVFGALFLGITAPNNITTIQCSSFTDRGQRLGCFYGLGIKNSDLDSCLEVPSAVQYPAGPQCVQKALHQLEAQNKLTTTLCDALKNSEAKSVCYYKIAVITKNKLLCSKVIDSYTDENMSVNDEESVAIGDRMEIPNKKNCLTKTN